MAKLSRNVLGSLGLLVIGVIYLYEAFKLPIGKFSYPDRGFMPLIIGFALIGFCLVQIVLDIFFPHLGDEKSILKEEEDVAEGESTGPKKPLIIIVSLLIYCGLFNTLGFIVATIPLTFVCLRVMEYKSWWVSLIVAIIITLLTNYIFVGWLGVYFPSGILG